MWRYLSEKFHTVERLARTNTMATMVGSAVGVLGYGPSLALDYVAVLMTTVGSYAGITSSVLKNVQMFQETKQLEIDYARLRALTETHFPAPDLSARPAMLSMARYSPVFAYNAEESEFTARSAFASIQGAAEPQLTGITRWQKGIIAGYAYSAIVGVIAAGFLFHELYTCNRHENDTSNADPCYDTADKILIAIVVITLSTVIVTHMKVASDLRAWHRQLLLAKQYIEGRIQDGVQRVPTELQELAIVANRALPLSLRSPNVPPLAAAIFQNITALQQFVVDGTARAAADIAAKERIIDGLTARILSAEKEALHQQLIAVKSLIKSIHGDSAKLKEIFETMRDSLIQQHANLALMQSEIGELQMAPSPTSMHEVIVCLTRLIEMLTISPESAC